MRRTLALIVAALMLCCALASCGGREGVDLTNATTLADLKGAKLAAQSGTFHYDALVAQVPEAENSDMEDFTVLLTALKAGTIDGYVAEEPTAWAVCGSDDTLTYVPLKNNSTGFVATDAETGIAVAFATGSDMVALVNPVIAGISAETREALMRQMVAISENPDTATVEGGLALVSDKTDTSNGVLRIAMECAYDPFNWTQLTNANGAVAIQGKPGEYANGYDVQVAKYIAAELGMALEVYAYEWESLIPAVQAGTVDGIIAGMSPTEDREREVDFTDCYYNSNLVIVIKKQA